MFLRILIILITLCPLTTTLEAASFWDKVSKLFNKQLPEKKTTIKVLVVHDKPGAVLEVKGKYKLFDPNTKEHISTRFLGKRRFIQSLQGGIKWGEEFPGVYQLLIVPDHETTTTLIDGIEYKGLIYVYDIGGTISIVNELNYDDYLNAILSFSVDLTSPEEALAALAITARTDAVYCAQQSKSPYWSVEAEQVGYQGHALIKPNSPLAKAIKETHHMVMSYNAPVGMIKTFPVEWEAIPVRSSRDQGISSRITWEDAIEMARNGAHAAQILNKAFNNVHVDLIRE